MDRTYFIHPNRLPLNADGPFYTTGSKCPETPEPNSPLVWCGECLACEAPEAEAPELLAPLTNDNLNTYFIRQPSTPLEIERACMALRVCCVAALRYGGKDHSIIERLNNDPEVCDYIRMPDGDLRLTVGNNGQLLPFAQRITEMLRAKSEVEYRRSQKQWWQFWR